MIASATRAQNTRGCDEVMRRRLGEWRWCRATGLVAIAAIIIFCSSSTYQSILTLPETIRLVSGDEHRELLPVMPLQICVRVGKDDEGLKANGMMLDSNWMSLEQMPLQLHAEAAGVSTVELRLLGLLPLRRLTVHTLEPTTLVPAGHAIGVMLESDGVMVLDYLPVTGQDGTSYPARSAGIRPGDMIEKIDGRPVRGKDHLAERVDDRGRAGEPVRLTVRRDGERLHMLVWPRPDDASGEYRMGLTVRDGTAGVGTLTAYCSGEERFVGLGHEIADPRTGASIPLRSGRIVSASISEITRARDGAPGEKVGIFSPDDAVIGIVEKNTPVGIAGQLLQPPDGGGERYFPVALQDQVQCGPAEMWTVLEGGKLESFQIEIESTRSQVGPESKSMVVRVTDPDLLSRAGGIVQGMSGSPILQDGRFVGAVTHVFVNEPARGYAVYAEWIAQELDLMSASGPPGRSVPLRGVAGRTG